MSELDLENIEQVDVPQMPMMPPVEEVIRQAGFGVQKLDTPQGQVIVLQFVTPVKAYTFQMDEKGAEALSEAVKPSRVIPASPADLARLAP